MITKTTKKEQNLLSQDLCARLLYGVKVSTTWWNEEKGEDEEIIATLYSINTDGYCEILDHDGIVYISNIKPFLRPLYSMTEAEAEELLNLEGCYKIDWMNKHMFDYRDLIPKDLAVIAPENMYEYSKSSALELK